MNNNEDHITKKEGNILLLVFVIIALILAMYVTSGASGKALFDRSPTPTARATYTITPTLEWDVINGCPNWEQITQGDRYRVSWDYRVLCPECVPVTGYNTMTPTITPTPENTPTPLTVTGSFLVDIKPYIYQDQFSYSAIVTHPGSNHCPAGTTYIGSIVNRSTGFLSADCDYRSDLASGWVKKDIPGDLYDLSAELTAIGENKSWVWELYLSDCNVWRSGTTYIDAYDVCRGTIQATQTPTATNTAEPCEQPDKLNVTAINENETTFLSEVDDILLEMEYINERGYDVQITWDVNATDVDYIIMIGTDELSYPFSSEETTIEFFDLLGNRVDSCYITSGQLPDITYECENELYVTDVDKEDYGYAFDFGNQYIDISQVVLTIPDEANEFIKIDGLYVMGCKIPFDCANMYFQDAGTPIIILGDMTIIDGGCDYLLDINIDTTVLKDVIENIASWGSIGAVEDWIEENIDGVPDDLIIQSPYVCTKLVNFPQVRLLGLDVNFMDIFGFMLLFWILSVWRNLLFIN